jgi:hypothetical protein
VSRKPQGDLFKRRKPASNTKARAAALAAQRFAAQYQRLLPKSPLPPPAKGERP